MGPSTGLKAVRRHSHQPALILSRCPSMPPTAEYICSCRAPLLFQQPSGSLTRPPTLRLPWVGRFGRRSVAASHQTNLEASVQRTPSPCTQRPSPLPHTKECMCLAPLRGHSATTRYQRCCAPVPPASVRTSSRRRGAGSREASACSDAPRHAAAVAQRPKSHAVCTVRMYRDALLCVGCHWTPVLLAPPPFSDSESPL